MSNRNHSGLGLLGVLLTLPLCILIGVTVYKSIQFNIHCGGHLKRAADANTIKIAKAELEYALNHMDANRMTTGTTSILWETPSNDVGFWYNNIHESYKELEKLDDSTDQMTKTNTLMKLRETLLDHRDSGDSVTTPEGISRFPNNTFYLLLTIGFSIVALVGAAIIAICIGG